MNFLWIAALCANPVLTVGRWRTVLPVYLSFSCLIKMPIRLGAVSCKLYLSCVCLHVSVCILYFLFFFSFFFLFVFFDTLHLWGSFMKTLCLALQISGILLWWCVIFDFGDCCRVVWSTRMPLEENKWCEVWAWVCVCAVSYTHLTLPTTCGV